MLEELQRLETLGMVEGAGAWDHLGALCSSGTMGESYYLWPSVSSSVKGASTHLWGSCED